LRKTTREPTAKYGIDGLEELFECMMMIAKVGAAQSSMLVGRGADANREFS
jgi:hypothetical protein